MVDRALTGPPWFKAEHDREQPTGARIHRVGITSLPAGGKPVLNWVHATKRTQRIFWNQ
jgi:hypothetical protein